MSGINHFEFPNRNVSWPVVFTGAYRLYVSPVIALFGIMGNVFVIIIFLLEHKKSRFSIYCIAISSTHIVILLVNTLMDDFMGEGLKYHNPEFYIKFDTQSLVMCRLMEFLHNVMYTASSGLLLVFSIDRITTIFRPMQFYSIHYRKFAIYLCLGVLFIAALINVPLLLSSELSKKKPKKCKINDSNLVGKTSIFVKVFVTFIIPTFIILFLNVVICLKLWKAKIQRAKLQAGDLQKNNIEMNRICGHLALNSAFLLFTFPLVISMLLRQINDRKTMYKDLSKMFSSIKDISYALDFLLYVTFLTNFRWRFIRYVLAPVLRATALRNTGLGLYVASRLMKHDSNSSRRRYSAITAALSKCSIFKPKDQLRNVKQPLRECVSYGSESRFPPPLVTPVIQWRCQSMPRQKEVTYHSDKVEVVD